MNAEALPSPGSSSAKCAMSSPVPAALARVARLFPRLTNTLRKGDCGRMAVIGGSKEYTGAPYFSAMTQMRMGADLSFVFCHPQSAPIIKSYSPELIVYPSYELDESALTKLGRCHSIVVGPGLGRDRELGLPLMRGLMEFARRVPTMCLVVDADALLYLPECLDSYQAQQHRFENVMLTPNYGEFARLCERVLPREEAERLKDDVEKAKMVAAKLGMNLTVKGEEEIITDGHTVLHGSMPGCPRRCGGLGDILGGATALLSYWALMLAHGGPSRGERAYTAGMMLEGALAASDFVRFTSGHTFANLGRAMNAADVIENIADVVKIVDAGGVAG